MKNKKTAAAQRICRVGGIEYILIQKDIKNMYLRINREGKITVTANKKIPLIRVEKFVSDNAEKISDMLKRLSSVPKTSADNLPADNECIAFFSGILMKYYPFFKSCIGDTPPEIKVKLLKSAWGICHVKSKYITFNKLLFSKPLPAIEYVVVHELCHFAHPNHQKSFYNEISRIMPDYKDRIAMLKRH